ncbi:MAG: hypothetical protein ACFBRM_12915 [Pikeienuella sp.]
MTTGRGWFCAAWALLVGLVAGPGAAEAPRMVEAGRVLAVVEGNWRNAGPERAVLVLGREAADLYIYGAAPGFGGSSLLAEARGIAWTGGMFGTRPSLDLAASGSLQVISQNTAIGRHRWRRVLTIAHRDGAYRIAGFTYEAYDTLDPAGEVACDVNLLTGRGVRNGIGFRTRASALPVADWSEMAEPAACFD